MLTPLVKLKFTPGPNILSIKSPPRQLSRSGAGPLPNIQHVAFRCFIDQGLTVHQCCKACCRIQCRNVEELCGWPMNVRRTRLWRGASSWLLGPLIPIWSDQPPMLHTRMSCSLQVQDNNHATRAWQDPWCLEPLRVLEICEGMPSNTEAL